MPDQRVLVCRHRQSTWNAQRRWTGQADPSLSADGITEARVLGEMLASHSFDAIVSSSSLRARQTAELVSAAIDVPIVGVDDRLREHDVPRWTGLTREAIEAIDPGVMECWRNGTAFDLPGAEAWEAFEQRIQAGLIDAAGRGATVLVVAHAGVLRAIQTGIGGRDLKVSRRKGQWLRFTQGELRLDGLERIVEMPAST